MEARESQPTFIYLPVFRNSNVPIIIIIIMIIPWSLSWVILFIDSLNCSARAVSREFPFLICSGTATLWHLFFTFLVFFVFYFGGCLILPPLVVPSFVYLYFFSFIHCSYRGISLLLLFVCLLFDFIIVPHFPFFFCGQFLIMFLNSWR